MLDYYSDVVDLVKQGARVFVPGIGMIDGAIEMVTTGSPIGAARVFVPGLGMVEGAVEGTAAFFRLTGGTGAGDAVKNAGLSIGTLALLVGGVLLVVLAVRGK